MCQLHGSSNSWLKKELAVGESLAQSILVTVRRRGGARIRWKQMSSLDQLCIYHVLMSICMCVPMCDIFIILYCYVSTLTPLYVRPPNPQTINSKGIYEFTLEKHIQVHTYVYKYILSYYSIVVMFLPNLHILLSQYAKHLSLPYLCNYILLFIANTAPYMSSFINPINQ